MGNRNTTLQTPLVFKKNSTINNFPFAKHHPPLFQKQHTENLKQNNNENSTLISVLFSALYRNTTLNATHVSRALLFQKHHIKTWSIFHQWESLFLFY
jgi:hypothetical protein